MSTPTSWNPLAALFANRATPAATPATPAVGSVTPTTGPATGSTIPAFQQSATEAPKVTSPMADHTDLFTMPKQEGEAPITLDDPFLNVDRAKVAELAKTMNFAPSTPEMQALAMKALQGDMQAFTEYNNAMMQNMYVQVLTQTSGISEKIAREGINRLKDTIPNTVRSISTTSNLQKQNPIFTDPAAKPMVDMIRAQVELKNPTATPEQVTEQVAKYFQDFAGVIAPKAVSTEPTNPYGGTTNYEGFFSQ